jgi:hypothetical protein
VDVNYSFPPLLGTSQFQLLLLCIQYEVINAFQKIKIKNNGRLFSFHENFSKRFEQLPGFSFAHFQLVLVEHSLSQRLLGGRDINGAWQVFTTHLWKMPFPLGTVRLMPLVLAGKTCIAVLGYQSELTSRHDIITSF